MKKTIVSLLKTLEKEEHIRILFAVESGSRLWRISSKDSDYDVRFVFIQPLENYLSLNPKAREKVINRTYLNGLVDISGFDIFKFCSLLAISNPSIIEWLQSDILYYGKKPEGLKKIALEHFNPVALFYHYQSMCKQNYEKYLASRLGVTYKKYLYALRGLFNAKYVELTQKLPPIHFPDCLKKLEQAQAIPQDIIEEIQVTLQKKKEGKEKEIIRNIVRYDHFIEEFLRQRRTELKGSSPNQREIDKELQKIILSPHKKTI